MNAKIKPNLNVKNYSILGVMLLGALLLPLQTGADYAPANPALVMDFNTTLEPGIWHGFFVSQASANQAYLVEITPLKPSKDGAHIERYVVQPEFNGEYWADVLRVQIPAELPSLEVNIRVLAIKTRSR